MSKRIALVVAETGDRSLRGESIFVDGIGSAMRDIGFEVETIPVPHDESSYEAVSDTYARYGALDLHGFDGVICSNIPACLVPHRNKVCYLLRTAREFYDMFDMMHEAPAPEQRRLRRHIQDLDREALKKVGEVFVAGYEIRGRLLKYLGADSEVLYPAATLDALENTSYEFLLLPGPLHPLYRPELVVRAMEKVGSPVELLVCGIGESEQALKEMASKMSNIHFLGDVDDDKIANLYSRSLAVPYIPMGEDSVFVILEAALCEKPVITCTDSGEPARMVYDGRTGFVVPPDPGKIARCIDILVGDPGLAAAMGRIARGAAGHASWGHVASVLARSMQFSDDEFPVAVSATGGGRIPPPRTLILDSQSISPANRGDRARALGLYGNMGFKARFLGVVEEGGKERRLDPTPTLAELNVPLSEEHLKEMESLKNQPGGLLTLDISFSLFGHLTPDYAATAERLMSEADALIFSRPWSFSLIEKWPEDKRQLLVYDAHRVEAVDRCAVLDDGASGTELVALVGELESKLCSRADLILTSSHADRASFARLYDLPYEKIRVAPNGAFVERIMPASHGRKVALKEEEGLTDSERETRVAIFMGSASPSNTEAAEFILCTVAPSLPDVRFLFMGSVCDAVSCPVPGNARLLGVVDDEKKNELLSMADIALNPIFSDGASNLKMLDYMAAGLPVLASAATARGIDLGGLEALTFTTKDGFVGDLRELLEEPAELERSGSAGRRIVEERHSWTSISRDVGDLLRWHSWHRERRRPFFSIIVVGYERPQSLWRLARLLSVQTYGDFELIIIDQSQAPWEGEKSFGELDMLYLKTNAMSVARAKNTGAFLSRGTVLVFLDDDCEPSANWLACARPWFDDENMVGLEGAIRSDLGWNDGRGKAGDERSGDSPQKASNFFVSTEAFNRSGGFEDIGFDDDSEGGMRAGALGEIPFSRDAWVFVPSR